MKGPHTRVGPLPSRGGCADSRPGHEVEFARVYVVTRVVVVARAPITGPWATFSLVGHGTRRVICRSCSGRG